MARMGRHVCFVATRLLLIHFTGHLHGRSLHIVRGEGIKSEHNIHAIHGLVIAKNIGKIIRIGANVALYGEGITSIVIGRARLDGRVNGSHEAGEALLHGQQTRVDLLGETGHGVSCPRSSSCTLGTLRGGRDRLRLGLGLRGYTRIRTRSLAGRR